MKACVYYDVDAVSETDLRLVRGHCPGATEVARPGALPQNGGAVEIAMLVPDHRALAYQDELMLWLSRLFALLCEAENSSLFTECRGVSLFEVARYQVHSEFAAVEQRWRALSEIIRREAPDRLIWVAPRSEFRQLRQLNAAQGTLKIEFMPSGGFAQGRRIFDVVKAAARPIVHLLRRAVARRRSDYLRLPAGGLQRVVFTEFFANNVEALAPVDAELRERYGLKPIWLAGRAAVKQALERHGITGYQLSLVDPDSPTRALDRRSRQALSRAIDSLPDQAFEGTAGVSGRAFLAPALKDCLARRLAEAAQCVEAFDSAYRRLGNQCVVTATYTSPVGRASALVARRLGRRSVFVQHGFIIPNAFASEFCSDRLLLWGQYDARNQVHNGIDRQRIGVTGATIYDPLIKGNNDRLVPPSDGEGALSVALLASRTGGTFVSYPAAERCLTSVAEAIGQIRGARLVIKPHPSDRTPLIEEVARRFERVEIARDEKSRAVIERSQIVVVVSSTTGIEACVAQKPLVVLQIGATTNFLPYGEYDAAVVIRAEQQDLSNRIGDAIRAIQEDAALRERLAQGRRRLLDDMLDGARGDAAERVATEIYEQLTGPPPHVLQTASKHRSE